MKIRDVPGGRVIETILFDKPTGFTYRVEEESKDCFGCPCRIGYDTESGDKFYLPIDVECRYIDNIRSN